MKQNLKNSKNLEELFTEFSYELININYEIILLKALILVLTAKTSTFANHTYFPNMFIKNTYDMLTVRVTRLLDKREKDTLNLIYLLKEVKKYHPDLAQEVKQDILAIDRIKKTDTFTKIKTIRHEEIAHKAISPSEPLQRVKTSDFEIIFQINNIFKKYNSKIFDTTHVIVPTFSVGEEGLLEVFTFAWLDTKQQKSVAKDLKLFRNKLFEKDGINMI